jgi:hypothetical protein
LRIEPDKLYPPPEIVRGPNGVTNVPVRSNVPPPAM